MNLNEPSNQNSPWWWRWLQNTSPLVRLLILIIIYVIVGLALEELAWLFRTSERVQPWDPAAGWNIVFLFSFGLRYGLAIPLVSIMEVVFLRPDESFVQGIVNGTYIAIFATGCSALLLYKLDIDPRLNQLSYVVKFAVVSILGTLAYAIVDMKTLLVFGKIEQAEWLSKTMHEWAGEATGIAMLAPPLLILLRNFPWQDKRLDLKGAAPKINFSLSQFKDTKEWLGLFIITFFFTWLAHGGVQSESLEYTYFTFIPLILVCAWKGFELTTIVTLAINITAVFLVGRSARNTSGFALQFGLMTVTYVGLLLSAFVSARSEESTKRQGLEEQLRHDATHDSLTGLYNRGWFIDRLEQTTHKAKGDSNYLFAMLFLDLDRFKNVNDSLGHIVGDRLLVQIAQHLQECIPENASIARLGGDEFTILLEEITDISQVTQVADTICKSLPRSYTVNSYQVFTSVSVGIASNLNNCAIKALDLLRNADIALYEAKNRGKSQYVLFDSQMYNRVIGQTQLEQDLRTAIDELKSNASKQCQFVVFYQPSIDLATGKISSFEALVRWQHPTIGMISPLDFIPLAEDTGLIIPLGNWVLKTAVNQLSDWQKEFSDLAEAKMAVNISAKQLVQIDLFDRIQEILQTTKLNPNHLKLEITESLLMDNFDRALFILGQLKKIGIGLSIDDFGTGYSSLSRLQSLPIDIVKIDRSFVRDMEHSLEKQKLVKAIADMVHVLNMKTVVEGVETVEQLEIIRELNCYEAQGYYFAKPLDFSAVDKLISNQFHWRDHYF